MGLERQYKIPIFRLTGKAKILARERKARSKNYKALSPFEREIFWLLQEHGKEVLELTGKGYIVDDSLYARRISEICATEYANK